MNWLGKYLRSSIGKKHVMGLSGIGLYGFLLVHLLGNVGLLAGPERFNRYGHLLLHDLAEIIVPIEIGLIILFVAHIVFAIWLRRENLAARPVRYQAPPVTGRGKGAKPRKSLYSMTMLFTGLWILVFTVIHIAHFRYGAVTGAVTVVYDGVEMRDLYTTAMNGFAVWWYTLAYVVTMLLIASHLAHGVQSSFQSLGLNHPKYFPFVQWAGKAYAVLISGGFSLLAIWAFFQGGAS